jgi:hypothetical protein
MELLDQASTAQGDRFMRYFALLGAATLTCLCSGCTGAVIQNVSDAHALAGRDDGMVISYALPNALLTFSAVYISTAAAAVMNASGGGGNNSSGSDKNATVKAGLTITQDQSFTIYPDTSRQFYLSYAHAGLSSDTVSVAVKGALLQQISSESNDQTAAAIESLNKAIVQLGSTEKALAPASGGATSKREGPAPLVHLPPPADCDAVPAALQATRTINLSDGDVGATYSPQTVGPCTLRIVAKITPQGPEPTFASSQHLGADMLAGCRAGDLVCFPLARLIELQVTVEADDAKGVESSKTEKFLLTVPREDDLGFVRFDRRAFVDNKTTVKFDTQSGTLTEFDATDPSAVAGAFNVASDLLATAADVATIAKTD